FDIPATAIRDNHFKFKDISVDIQIREGIDIDAEGKITLKNQVISDDENQAVKIRRYIDFVVTNTKGDNFSMETLAYTTIADTRNFSLKWMYSIDGKIFLPITEFLLPVEKSVTGIPFGPPLYLPV